LEQYEDFHRGKERDEDNRLTLKKELENNPYGDDSEMPFSNEVTKREQFDEEAQQLHLKHKDKSREHY